mmetsp:Transcript_17982/g.30605  ORF Transcript_17982/g.30605 Transcript_17982/m.30605 type:complete len:218 (-) Transcript_17982:53-706(-)
MGGAGEGGRQGSLVEDQELLLLLLLVDELAELVVDGDEVLTSVRLLQHFVHGGVERSHSSVLDAVDEFEFDTLGLGDDQPRLLGNSHLLTLLCESDSHPRRLVRLGVDQVDVTDVDGELLLRRLLPPHHLLVVDLDVLVVDALHQHLVLLPEHLQHLSNVVPLLARVHNYEVTPHNMPVLEGLLDGRPCKGSHRHLSRQHGGDWVRSRLVHGAVETH